MTDGHFSDYHFFYAAVLISFTRIVIFYRRMGVSLKSFKFDDLLEREDGWVPRNPLYDVQFQVHNSSGEFAFDSCLTPYYTRSHIFHFMIESLLRINVYKIK